MTYTNKQKLSAINAAFTKYFGRAANQSELDYYSKSPGRFAKLNTNILGDQKNLLPQYRKNNQSNVNLDKTQAPDVTNFPDVPGPPLSQEEIIKKIVEGLYPKTTPPPSFEQSGLYDEAAIAAQAQADYQPAFAQENESLQKEQERQRNILRAEAERQALMAGQEKTALGQQQQQQTGDLLSDYYNRGLSHSGGFQGAKSLKAQQQNAQLMDLNQRQLLASQDIGERQRLQQYQQPLAITELQQRQKSILADVKARAYQNAFQRYLNQFGAK